MDGETVPNNGKYVWTAEPGTHVFRVYLRVVTGNKIKQIKQDLIVAPISGSYNIIVDNQIGQQLLLSKVPIAELTFTIVDTLRNSGNITGNIKADTFNLTIGEKTFFSLLGTDFTTVQLASEQFEFKDIPHGKYDIFHIEKMELQDKNDTLTVKDINKKLSQTNRGRIRIYFYG